MIVTILLMKTNQLKMLSKCYDYINEKTSLQHNGAEMRKKMGFVIIIDRNPKCHP